MKICSTYYFVQALETENSAPKIVAHTTDEKTGELYYKFMDKKKAVKLMNDERKVNPEFKFRVVKLIEKFESSDFI